MCNQENTTFHQISSKKFGVKFFSILGHLASGIMPRDKRTVQTLLTKTGQQSKEITANHEKITDSEVAEENNERTDLSNIHSELCEIKTTLLDSVTKPDLTNAVKSLVQKSELREMVTAIVTQLLTSMKEDYDTKLKDETSRLQNHIDALYFENNNLKEKLHTKEKEIKQLTEDTNEINIRSKEALKQANYNEQYSRKNNIRILNLPEQPNENLRQLFPDLVKKDLKITIAPSDIVGIHRIPGKEGAPRPVIIKLCNNDMKRQVMKKKKDLTNNVRFHDDITKRNLGLMARLRQSGKLYSTWYFNCCIYGQKEEGGRRTKFDIFDSIDEKLSVSR